MTAWTLLGGMVTVGSVMCLAYAVFRMRSGIRQHTAAEAGSPAGGFSIDRYRPMERLLSAEDLEFLRRAHGYTPELGARWKKQQLRLFQMYLAELRCDFRQLHAAARAIVANTHTESPEIVRALVSQRVQFEYVSLRLELEIRMAQCGLGQVSAKGLIAMVERMRQELEVLAPRPMPILVS
jgi:hypothetical protein